MDMEKNEILISIVIPVYNVEKYLGRCMDSIINQTYKNLEIIMVDDGSTDSCPQMCENYSKQDNRIRVIHKKNGGLSSARNAGIDIAIGDFLMFVDSDDYISNITCEKVVECISDEVDVVSFLFKRIYDDTSRNEQIKENGEIRRFQGKEIFKNYINRTDFTHMVCDKAFRRFLFKDVRFIEGRLAEDMAICYQLIGKARRAFSIDEVFYFYYMRNNSIMGSGSLKLFLDAYKGESEAYRYGQNKFPEFKKENDTRFLNQSMKTYLKLIKIHGNSVKSEDLKRILNNIQRIDKSDLPISTKLFYSVFRTNKSLAWLFFKVLKLS